MKDFPLLEALKGYLYPKKLREKPDLHNVKLRYVIETENSLDVRSDVPLNWEKRLFGNRCVDNHFYSLEDINGQK